MTAWPRRARPRPPPPSDVRRGGRHSLDSMRQGQFATNASVPVAAAGRVAAPPTASRHCPGEGQLPGHGPVAGGTAVAGPGAGCSCSCGARRGRPVAVCVLARHGRLRPVGASAACRRRALRAPCAARCGGILRVCRGHADFPRSMRAHELHLCAALCPVPAAGLRGRPSDWHGALCCQGNQLRSCVSGACLAPQSDK